MVDPTPVAPTGPGAPAAAPAAPTVAVTNVPGAQKAVIDTSATAVPSDPAQPLVDDGIPPMPEGGQEKYYNAETGAYNWEAAFKEEAWKAATQAATPADNAEPNAAGDAENTPADQAAQEAANAAGVDHNEFNAYVAEHGEVSEEHLAAFEKAGISREIVEDYANMKIAAAVAHVEGVQEYLGGENGMALLRDYMGKNFSAEEVSAFEKQLMDPGAWRATAAFLLQTAGLPQAGRGLVKGPNAAPASATSGEKFNSEAEFNAAMRDPRYKADPAFRARVEAAVRNSPQLMGTGPSHSL